MQERPTRHIAIVVLLLAAALMLLGSVGTTHAASQRRQGQKTVFMPAVMQRPAEAATRDMTITHLGVYQTVQTASNSVSLVQDKPTLLRVFAQSSGAATPPMAEVTVHAWRGTTALGSLTLGPQIVPAHVSSGDLHSTFNFDLPAEWLSGEVVLTATVDAVNTVPEANESNNEFTAQFVFHPVAPLQITIVPIRYTDTRTGREFVATAHDPISRWLLNAYPVSRVEISYHPPLAFTGDLRQPAEWKRLLDSMTTLWAAEVGYGSARVYYGLIANSDATGAAWFEGGVSGLGWIGERVSLGLDVGAGTGNSAGHEIGHNFGRQHAPCGNPSSVDPHYPYPNATIGVYGVDTEDEVLLAPGANYDMMSYCGPEWVSDYTYEALFRDQQARTGRAADRATDGLLLRARLSDEGAEALPVYRLSGVAAPAADSGYSVELVGADGATLASYPASLLQAEETDVSAQMIVAQVPAPRAAVAAVRFLSGGRVLAERPLGVGLETAATAEVVASGDALKLKWGRPEVPALVRVSADGQQWTVLALDALGGQLALARHELPAGGQVQIIPGDGQPPLTITLD